MRGIQLTKGKAALVDDDDFERLSQFKWYAICVSRNRNGEPYWYAYRTHQVGGKRRFVMMHRSIMGVSDRLLIVDHKDFNTLNNQKTNLRVCTKSENCSSFRPLENKTSPYVGVSWDKGTKKWFAKIRNNYKQYYLGVYTDPVDAARAYNKAAIEFHGQFATLNPV